MTVDELRAREAIRRTMARYTMAGDRLRVADFVATFTVDGVIEAEGIDPADAFRFAGREAIVAWMTRWRERPADAEPTHRASFVRHHLTTCDIDLLGPDTARARTYWIAWTDAGADHAGLYLDTFARIGDDWLIAHRRIREDWRATGSLFHGAVDRSR